MKPLEIAGQTFHHLIALRRDGCDAASGKATWIFRCECGVEVCRIASAVKYGGIKSCGCLDRAASAERCRSRATHGMTGTPTFNSWQHARDRCGNTNHPAYSRYGGRGITVCERWNSFENFLADMGERPAGKSLDRYPDPDGHYEPGNCRWATPIQQRNNRSHAYA